MTGASIIGLITFLLQFGLTVLNLFFSKQAEQDKKDAANAKEDDVYHALALAALTRMNESRKKRSNQARDMDRQMEDDKGQQ